MLASKSMILYKFKSVANALYSTDRTRKIIIAPIGHRRAKLTSETAYSGIFLQDHTLKQLRLQDNELYHNSYNGFYTKYYLQL